VDLPETGTLGEVPLAGFGVGEENLLPDGCVRLEDRGHQGPPDPGPPRVRLDQDVLDVADAHPLGDDACESDAAAVLADGHDVGGPGNRGGQGAGVLEVGDPAD